MLEERTVTTEDGEMGLVVAHPDGAGPFPVVVFFHHGPGMDEGSKRAIQLISDAGYYVIGPDRYYRHGRFLTFDLRALRSPDADPELSKRFFEIFGGTTDEHMERDVRAVLASLETDPAARPAPMGCIGYCIGARTVLRTLAAHPDVFSAGICLHPSACVTEDDDSPHRGLEGYEGYLYVGIGSEDRMQSAEMHQPLIDLVEKMGERGAAEVHEGADHGFAIPGGHAYHEQAASRSYDRALDMFDRALRRA